MEAISQKTLSNVFYEWKVLYFVSNFSEVCSKGSNWQYPNIGVDNGLAPNRWQAIIWNNADPIYWRICGPRWRWVKGHLKVEWQEIPQEIISMMIVGAYKM